MPITGPTQVNTQNFTNFSAGAVTFTVGVGGIPSGALIEAVLNLDNTGSTASVTSVTDSKSSWTVVQSVAPTGMSVSQKIFTLWAIAGSAYTNGDTIAVNFDQRQIGVGRCNNWTGIASSTPQDKAAADAAAESFGTTYTSTATATTSQANELLIGWLVGGSATITPGSGWTQDYQDINGGIQLDTHYQVVSATGAYSETGTQTAQVAAAGIVTYKAAAGGPAPNSGFLSFMFRGGLWVPRPRLLWVPA